MQDYGYTVYAHIHSLKGEMDEARIIGERQEGNQTIYIAEYKGTKCTAIFNPFVCQFYVDDKYGMITED